MGFRDPAGHDRACQIMNRARHLAAPAASDEPTSSVLILRALSAAVSAAGADAVAFLGRVGLAPETLGDVEARVPIRVTARAWELAAERTGDADLGLHLAQHVPAGTFDLVEYAMRSCATYGEALEHMARYYRLLEDAAEIAVERDGARARVVHRLVDPRWSAPRHGVEAVLASWVRRARGLAGGRFTLREVWFRHAAPADVTAHEQLFRAPLRFGAADSGIGFDRAWLDLPQPTADPGLRAVLDRQADALLARLPAAGGLVARTRRAVVQALPDGKLGLASIARRVGTSGRSLQRGLAAEATSFQDVLAMVRQHLASGYLENDRMTLAEIAFALGFSEASAFQRAFRRWTGRTAQEYRRSAR
jgi:AraC-like DNA-binding protein